MMESPPALNAPPEVSAGPDPPAVEKAEDSSPAASGCVAVEDGAAQTVPSEEGRKNRRLLVAIGDLHGDYYRLIRILEENHILIRGTLAWNPERGDVDLILIGDYVDWRGETLEGERSEWVRGPFRILKLIYKLTRDIGRLHCAYPEFDARFYPLVGNHDEMMFEATKVFEFLTFADIRTITQTSRHFANLKRIFSDLKLTYEQTEIVLRLLNWYYQGGDATIEGFGGLEAWKDEMDGELGRFLRTGLKLGVVVNNKLFSHSIPDSREFWLPIGEIEALPSANLVKARESFLWGRKVWGYDFYSGTRTSPFSQKEIEEMLEAMRVDGIVVGHTPMSGKDPIYAFEKKIVNIDLHGNSGSKAFIEEYDVS
jgi:hypothetical protein